MNSKNDVMKECKTGRIAKIKKNFIDRIKAHLSE